MAWTGSSFRRVLPSENFLRRKHDGRLTRCKLLSVLKTAIFVLHIIFNIAALRCSLPSNLFEMLFRGRMETRRREFMCEIPSIGISLDSHGLRNVAVFLSASTMFVCLFLASPFHLFQQSSQVTNRMSLSSLPDFASPLFIHSKRRELPTVGNEILEISLFSVLVQWFCRRKWHYSQTKEH